MYNKFIVILESYISRYIFDISESFYCDNVFCNDDSFAIGKFY